MTSSLDDLIKAMNGEIALNGDIEDLMTSLFNGFLPGKYLLLIYLLNLRNYFSILEKSCS